MINNAWKINEADRSYNKGWTNKDEEGSKGKSIQQAYGSQKGGISTAVGARP
jgi:hypothetical protein